MKSRELPKKVSDLFSPSFTLLTADVSDTKPKTIEVLIGYEPTPSRPVELPVTFLYPENHCEQKDGWIHIHVKRSNGGIDETS